jgi:polysaccharide biosynthesis transport protein
MSDWERVLADTRPTGNDLRHYFAMLRRRMPWILGLAVFVTAASAGQALTTQKQYQATAEILLKPKTTESAFSGINDPSNNIYVAERNVANEIQVLKGRPIREAVEATMGPISVPSVREIGKTDILALTATSTDPQRAANVANAYAEEYIKTRRQAAINDLLGAIKELQTKVTEFDAQINKIDEQISGADSDTQSLLEGQREGLIAQKQLFQQKIDGLEVDASLKSGGAQVVNPARAPLSPSAPNLIRSIIVGAFAGLALGLGLGLLIEFLDDSIKRREELERNAPGLPVLGLLPSNKSSKRSTGDLVMVRDDRSSGAEAYRALRTSLQFLSLDKPLQVLQVTSSMPGEGKSTVTANLAVALARSERRVLVIDLDLRRPRANQLLGTISDVGFTSVLRGEVDIDEAIVESSADPRVGVLAAGAIPPNPAELLASPRTRDLIEGLREEWDIILVDSPPTLPVTDAVEISQMVDGVLFIARAGKTRRAHVQRSLELLFRAGANVMGTVLNDAGADEGDGYGRNGYGYGRYGYGRDSHVDTSPSSSRPSRRSKTLASKSQ